MFQPPAKIEIQAIILALSSDVKDLVVYYIYPNKRFSRILSGQVMKKSKFRDFNGHENGPIRFQVFQDQCEPCPIYRKLTL